MNKSSPAITSWKDFARLVRSKGCRLLKQLDRFPNSILITGCQRSGTTILSRIITQSEGMVNYRCGKDDELDAALLLAGVNTTSQPGRYCFQTTYLNECYHEYYRFAGEHRIVWVLRNPYSVVYSMLYNWRRFAFEELFKNCGLPLCEERVKRRYKLFGKFGVSGPCRASHAYLGKTKQLIQLHSKIPARNLLVVEYDELVANREIILPLVYDFLDLPYQSVYASKLRTSSLDKKKFLKDREIRIIRQICEPVYNEASKLTISL